MKNPVEILETTIEHGAGGTIVRLHLADARKDDPHASIRLQLLATLPAYEAPLLLVHLQREALMRARDILAEQLQTLLQEIPERIDSVPTVKK